VVNDAESRTSISHPRHPVARAKYVVANHPWAVFVALLLLLALLFIIAFTGIDMHSQSATDRATPAPPPPAYTIDTPLNPDLVQLSKQAVKNFLRVPALTAVDELHRLRVEAALSGSWDTNAGLRAALTRLIGTSKGDPRSPKSLPLVYKSSRGWHVLSKAANRANKSIPYESHIDQLISTLAEIDVPTREAFHTDQGTATVLELLETSRREYVSDQESSWSLVAYAHYMPTMPRWSNRFGEDHSYEEAVRSLISKGLNDGPCDGTHHQYAVAYLLRLNTKYRFLSTSVNDDAMLFLRKSVDALHASQFPNGAWGPAWDDPISSTVPAYYRGIALDRLVQVTAHHLEWLTLLPENLTLRPKARVDAIKFLATALSFRGPKEMAKNYCGFSHAAKMLISLAQLKGNEPDDLSVVGR
jgi:hypothetical protein